MTLGLSDAIGAFEAEFDREMPWLAVGAS
jgi:hypothetical protein